MCRVLTYFGRSILLDDLLYKPDNALVKQSYQPLMMHFIQNLAGFGMVLWDKDSFDPDKPYLYKTPTLPFFDNNLKLLAEKIKVNCLLAHVRGVEYSETEMVEQQNVHPFLFPNSPLAMAHNGLMAKFDNIKYDLLPYMSDRIKPHIRGTTDSEWMYAVFMSQFETEVDQYDLAKIKNAMLRTFEIVKSVRNKNKIYTSSPANLFVTNGDFLMASRFVFNYGCYPENYERVWLTFHSLWYTYGKEYGKYEDEYRMLGEGDNKKSSIIIASEPLTQDTTTWIEVPEYSIITAAKAKGDIKISISNIDL